MTRVVGTRFDQLDPMSLSEGIRRVTDTLRSHLGDAGDVVLVPDAHYPYHPSTGMVTDPDVVFALAACLRDHLPDSDCVVGLRSSEVVDTDRTATYLGYESNVDSETSRVITLDAANRETTTVETEAGTIELPSILVENEVVAVPSARYGAGTTLRGGLATIAVAAGANPADETSVRGAYEATTPVRSVVDATRTFTGEPYRACTLLAGTDVGGVDSVLARLLALDEDDAPGLPALTGSSSRVTVEGVDIEALSDELPAGSLPDSNDPHPLVQAGYQVYTAASGDVFPPQLRRDG